MKNALKRRQIEKRRGQKGWSEGRRKEPKSSMIVEFSI
jgi:hypothetical protein